jgi:diguanylate cyclase
MNHQLLQQEIFSDIYQHKNKQHLIKANMLLDKYGAHIVNSFYTQLSSFKEAKDFLTTDLVETRLKHSLKNWLLSISDFSLNHDYSIYLEKQQMIGKVHARIQVPMYLVNYGVDNLKQLIFETLLKEKIDANEKVIMINLINRIIDLAVMLFNNIYFDNSIKQKKNEQSLRQHYVSHDLAIEFEQSRTNLLHWHRELITLLFYPYSKVKTRNITPLSQSKFGLWVEHRAALLFYNQGEVKKLQSNLYKVDEQVKQVVLLNQAENWEQLADNVTELDSLIIATDWLLDQIAKEIIALDNNKDPLTKMFTRRYLPNIIQHEIHYCLERNVSLGIIMIDLDHFKNINDQYGHSVGDTVLSKTASILSTSIRAYDYIFRYGGEEFVILINNTDTAGCLAVAEEIRVKVANYQYKDLPFIIDPITISLGVAIFDKHPDYEQLINHADQALYVAKENGRNRVELYKE